MKRAFHWLGALLALISVAYIIYRLAGYRDQLDLSRLDSTLWMVGALLVFIYAAVCYLLPLAWQQLMTQLGAPLATPQAIRVYGQSQLAKYVPGNVMHFLGRQALGLAHGLDGWALAKSSLWEIGLLVLAAVPFLPLALFPLGSGPAMVVFAGLAAAIFLLLRAVLGTRTALAYLCYTGLLLVFGAIFAIIMTVISVEFSPGVSGIILLGSAYVCAWLVGMVTPGASAGIGIREVVVLALLAQFTDKPTLLLAVLLCRVITTLGDFLFFGLSFLARDTAAPA